MALGTEEFVFFRRPAGRLTGDAGGRRQQVQTIAQIAVLEQVPISAVRSKRVNVNVEAAVLQAADIATLIAREHLPTLKSQIVVVEVRDETGACVPTATVTLKIEPIKAYVTPNSSADRQGSP